MDKATTKENEKESGSQGQMQGQASDSSRSVQTSDEQGMARRAPASLFSLTPRDVFSANPFDLMRRFTEDMDQLFEGMSLNGSRSAGLWSPSLEISEKDGQLIVSAELPGISKDDVKVELTREGLTISGERKREQEDRREELYRSERSYGWFRRTIPIPDEAQVEKAKATFDNGLLTVSVPVPETKQHRREIPIEAGTEHSLKQSSSTAKAA